MLEKTIEKAGVLAEALPWIKKFYGKTIVIKFGGNVMDNKKLVEGILKDVVLLKYIGMNPIVVHGGGPAINETLAKLGKGTEFKYGNRVTDEATMEVVEMVLTGKINKELVTLINKHGGKAIGISGKDGNLIEAEKKYLMENNEQIDIGFVGKVKKINPKILELLDKEEYIPVISPVGVDSEGNTYNINADYVAGEIAGAVNADKFILLTNVQGIMKDPSDSSTLYSTLYFQEVNRLINGGTISGGMLPKVEACMEAIKLGVNRAHILDGRIKHALLLEVFTDEGIGTMIEKK